MLTSKTIGYLSRQVVSIRPLLKMLAITAVVGALPLAADAAEKHFKIAVYGGTGMIGQRIVNEALSRGDIVTIIVRDPATVTEKRDHVSVTKGNILDAGDVAKQIRGEDVVIEAVSSRASTGPSQGPPGAAPGGPPGAAPGGPPGAPPGAPAGGPPGPGGGFTPAAPQVEHFYTRVAENLVNAARQLGPKAPRLLIVGGAASLNDTNGKLLFDEIPGMPKTSDLWTTKEALDYLRTVDDVSWTVLSPAQQIGPGERTGKFRLGDDTIVKDANGKSRISAEDFSVAMIDEVHNPMHVRKRFTLAY